MSENIKALILAAGQGKRMRTEGADLPKVMREANGRPLLGYVLTALDFLPAEDRVIIAGFMRETLFSAFGGFPFAFQDEQLGTAHAVMCGMAAIKDFAGDVLVCCGDMPLLRRETYLELIGAHRESGADCTLLSGVSAKPLPYGRIVRDSFGGFEKIAEEKDCSPAQLTITELNAGVYVFNAAALRAALSGISRENAQGEYYLTDAPCLIKLSGGSVKVFKRELNSELIGVNTPEQLLEVETELLLRNKQ